MVTGGLVKLGEAFENSVYKLQLIAVAPADMEDARVRVGPWTGARSEREGVCCSLCSCRERRRHDMGACMDAQTGPWRMGDESWDERTQRGLGAHTTMAHNRYILSPRAIFVYDVL